ncbi:MAG: PEGA domain-containing protein [Desulfobacterota bacterium]|nr:PEGA domain-containing protein [Thermodesulfobacteriota bacterium]
MIRIGLLLVLALLAGSVWFVLTVKQVSIAITPEPDRLTLSGTWPSMRIGESYLLQPGTYLLRAQKQGYRDLERALSVGSEKNQQFRYTMEKLPGRIEVTAYDANQVDQAIAGAEILLDGQPVGVTPATVADVQPGLRRLVIRAPRYKPLETKVDVEGMGTLQKVAIPLVPAWAGIRILSIPEGAQVFLDGKGVGHTPLHLDLDEGLYSLKLTMDRFKPREIRLEVKAGQPVTLEPIRLAPADGTLSLRTDPGGSTVTLKGQYAGTTPLDAAAPSGEKLLLRVSKPGYEELSLEVSLSPGERKHLSLTLTPRIGMVHFKVEPADALLLINGKPHGAVPNQIELLALEHGIEIQKEGYEPFSTRLTPRPGFPQELSVVLKKSLPPAQKPAEDIQTATGYRLRLVTPSAYTMGSSRREQGRRSNETARSIVLKRPFYMGTREVTNKEFRLFFPEHDSGSFGGQSLNRADQPVVRITWEQAALYCNWLSARESLPPVYVKRGDRLVAAEPAGPGYRLPTEAEWEYCARFSAKGPFQKYPWGDTFPPKPGTANIGDVSAKDLINDYVEGYNDGYPVSAAPGSFKPNALGIHDLAGNASEWCHDYYAITAQETARAEEDPTGPGEGQHRVVRGSSYKHGSISALRSAYRDYSNAPREDLGFRVCRYADEVAPKK